VRGDRDKVGAHPVEGFEAPVGLPERTLLRCGRRQQPSRR
jgi:hypothetical protein